MNIFLGIFVDEMETCFRIVTTKMKFKKLETIEVLAEAKKEVEADGGLT